MDHGTLLGTQVGNYCITSLLGRGGMGEVYLAEHPKIGRRVAVKVLARELVTDQLAERFLTEARAITRIGHPNVIEIYDFGSLEDGRLYYTMEVLDGRELRHVMHERGRMNADEVLPYLEQICAGLQAAHDHGVIHRDLKPENVFVLDREPLALKLLDFGIAKLLETKQGTGLTSSGAVMGTPLFMAPEQALGELERISARTDLYSLGVMIYAMLAGRPPFVGEVYAAVLVKHVHELPPPLASLEPSVPLEVATVVHRCLAKDPLERFGSATELLRAFSSAVELARSSPTRTTGIGAMGATQTDESQAGATDQISASPGGRPSPTVTEAPPPGTNTTFSGAASELRRPDAANNRVVRWIAIAAGAAVVVTATIVLLRDGASRPSPDGLTLRAATTPPHRPDATRANDVPRRMHAIVVHLNDASATCRLTVDRAIARVASPPCRFEVRDSARVRLEVERRGRPLFAEEWAVGGDRTIDLERGGHARPASGHPVKRTATPSTRPAPEVPVARVPPKPTVPDPERKKKPEHVGEGTLEME